MAAQTQTAARKMVKVRFIDSVAGLGESEVFDENGKKTFVKNTPYNLRREYSFRPGEVAVIDSELAEKWQEGGICELAPAEATIYRPPTVS